MDITIWMDEKAWRAGYLAGMDQRAAHGNTYPLDDDRAWRGRLVTSRGKLIRLNCRRCGRCGKRAS